MVACQFFKMGQDLVYDLLIFDTGDDFDRASAMNTGFHRAAFGSMLNTLFNRPLKGPTFGETRTWLCVSPQALCFLLVEFYRAERVLLVTGVYCLGGAALRRIRRESASD
jgi:hypothetical protein